MNEKRYTRFPIFPLSYGLRHMAIPGELMIDYEYGGVYVRNLEDTEDIQIASSDSIRHITDYNNPHKVDKEDVGLGNLVNKKQATADEFKAHLVADNPHKITKEVMGLGKVANYDVATVQDVLNGRPDKYITPAVLGQTVKEYGINIGQLFGLKIIVTPEDAKVEVRIDGAWKPGREHLIPLNTYKIKATKDGYLDKEVTVILNKDTTEYIELGTIAYTVNMNIEPEDALIEVRKVNDDV